MANCISRLCILIISLSYIFNKLLASIALIEFLPKYSKADQEGILDYCSTDVTTNEQLFYKQLDHIERFKNIKSKADAMRAITQALFAGRAIAVCAQIETNGIPIDEKLYFDIENNFESLKAATINEANKKYDLYVDGVLKKEKFAKFLKKFLKFGIFKKINILLFQEKIRRSYE